MWQKRGQDGGKKRGISMQEILSPMLTVSSLEATISECSLEVKPSRLLSPKTKERLVISSNFHQRLLISSYFNFDVLFSFGI